MFQALRSPKLRSALIFDTPMKQTLYFIIFAALSLLLALPARPTEVRSTALDASKVLLAGPGRLHRISISNTAGGYRTVQLINATSLPGNGPVSLLHPVIRIEPNSFVTVIFARPLTASTGIVAANSITDTFTLTIGSAELIFYADVE